MLGGGGGGETKGFTVMGMFRLAHAMCSVQQARRDLFNSFYLFTFLCLFFMFISRSIT
jgi:hypothetical protein